MHQDSRRRESVPICSEFVNQCGVTLLVMVWLQYVWLNAAGGNSQQDT
jgi:hypothetical protein